MESLVPPRKASRRSSRRDFGCVFSMGTPTEPRFGVRWYEQLPGSTKPTRRQKSGFKTKKDAQEELARTRVKIGDGTASAEQRAEISFDVVANEWLDLHSKPLRSHYQNKLRYENRIKPFFGTLPLSRITAVKVLEFKASLAADPAELARRTQNQDLQEVRAILRFAVVNGHIPVSPIERLGRGQYLLSLERGKLDPPIAAPADVGRLLQRIREMYPRLFGLFAAAVYCGLRKGELIGLRRVDVDLKRGFITVRHSYSGMTKSGRHREVPIPSPLRAILAQHMLEDPFKGEFMFPNDEGEMYTRELRLHDLLEAALKTIGLKKCRFHDLRHIYASHYVMCGGSIFDLQKNLGHSSVQVTSETYGHLSPSHRLKEAERLSFEAPESQVLPMKREG